MFLGLVILADDRDAFHVETGAQQRLHSIFRLGVLVIKCNGDIGIICRHHEIPFKLKGPSTSTRAERDHGAQHSNDAQQVSDPSCTAPSLHDDQSRVADPRVARLLMKPAHHQMGWSYNLYPFFLLSAIGDQTSTIPPDPRHSAKCGA